MASDDADPIKRTDAINLVKEGTNVKSFNSEKSEGVLEYGRLRVEAILQERLELRAMRLRWSNWILVCIVSIVCFDFLLVGAAGIGLAKFSDSYTLPAFLGESIINIIGLAIIIVRFLFSDKNELPKE